MFKSGQLIRLKQNVPPPSGYGEYYMKHGTPLNHMSRVIRDQRPGDALVQIQLIGIDPFVSAVHYELCVPLDKKLEDYM